MRKVSAFSIILLLSLTCFGANVVHVNPYISYDWTVSDQLLSDSLGSSDTLTHSFVWPPSLDPIGIVGSFIFHIDTILFISGKSWAYEEAIGDKYEIEAFDPSLETSYIVYFDSLTQDSVEGYILGATFKFWDEPTVYFQETRYLGYGNYGVEIYTITDTSDAMKYYSYYDQVSSSLELNTPLVHVLDFPLVMNGVQATKRIHKSLLISRSGYYLSNQGYLYNVFGARIRKQHLPAGVYLRIDNTASTIQ